MNIAPYASARFPWIFLTLFIFLFTSCEKHPLNARSKYEGDWVFSRTSTTSIHHIEAEPEVATTTYSGSIELVSRKELEIQYLEKSSRTVEVSKGGRMTEFSDRKTGNYFSGRFISENEMQMTWYVNHIGSSTTVTVMGTR